jgi:hypothetical protein
MTLLNLIGLILGFLLIGLVALFLFWPKIAPFFFWREDDDDSWDL